MAIPDSLMDDFIVYCHREIEDKYMHNAYYYQEVIISLYPKFIEKRKSEK
jgi:hypothetical protein